MKNRKSGLWLQAVCIAAFVGLSGCAANPAAAAEALEEEPISGGVTDKTDPNAPKEIRSDEISDFDAEFYLGWRWMGEDDHNFAFSVKPDEEGTLIAAEDNSGISLPADEKLLTALQEVIREYDLASMNGVYQVTAGLPPEFRPCKVTVRYASGEELTFTMDNDPEAEWAEDIYTVFAQWFKEQGNDALYPARTDAVVTRVSIDYVDPGQELFFDSAAKNPDGAVTLPDDYYETITQILDRYDVLLKYDYSLFNHESGQVDNHDLGFYGMGDPRPDHGEPDLEDTVFDLYVEYDDGKRINIETKKASELTGMQPMIEELLSLHEFLTKP
ncbi:MAG: hypothetical protein K6G83_04195 [Lachnospiraceae bacterium]|nr:hypothetical protein [Lachnospiraceae bacterium]